MPRSKKKKVVTEGRGDGATPSPTGATATEETPSTIVAEEDEDPLDDLDNMTEAELRRWTKAQVQKLKGLHAQALVDVRKAEAELRHEERRAEEREKRWDAAEQRAEPPPAYLQIEVERAYKSRVWRLEAQLKVAHARRVAGEAEASMFELMYEQESGEHACTREKLAALREAIA